MGKCKSKAIQTDLDTGIIKHIQESLSRAGKQCEMQRFGVNLKNPKKILGQTLKSQVKNEFPFPCIPTFKNL